MRTIDVIGRDAELERTVDFLEALAAGSSGLVIEGEAGAAELYLSKTGSDGLREAAARAHSAADELSREGRPVRYVRAIFVGEDETCFHLYEAATAESVVEATRRAGIPVERVVEAVEIAPARATPQARRPPGPRGEAP